MQVRFGNRRLEACAYEQRLAVREWGPEVGPRYQRRIMTLAQAPDFDALFALRSLRLHRLRGDRSDTYAITLHGRWRIILVRTEEDELLVVEVTNHYGD